MFAIEDDRDGNLRLGTDVVGLSRYSGGTLTSGGIWLGTNDGLNLVKDGKVTVYRISDGLPDNTVRVLAEDRQGNIWIGTRGGAVLLAIAMESSRPGAPRMASKQRQVH